MRAVWPDTFVGDDVLTRAISELRRVFGDDVKDPTVIHTIPQERLVSDGTILWRSRVDGSERLQLTQPPLQLLVPRWSRDSKRIASWVRRPDSHGKSTPLRPTGANPNSSWGGPSQRIQTGLQTGSL